VLVDRCLLTQKDGLWVGLTERLVRVGENFRFLAWLSAIVLLLAMIRILDISVARMGALDYISVGIPAIFAVVFFKISSQRRRIREIAIKIEKPRKVLDEDQNLLTQEQYFYLPKKDDALGFEQYDRNDCSHVVFGLIDYKPENERRGLTLEAYALYFARHDGSPLVIVESCFDKMSCYNLGRRIAAITSLPIIELGKGQPFA
jgi:hypothetical protein